jgi:hypothetical protein
MQALVDSTATHSPPPQTHIPLAQEGYTVPRYQKLSFLTYDGEVEPLGWLNKCEQFFHAQRTLDIDRVWYASYHMNGSAQQWCLVLERDAGEPTWDEFKILCQ